MHPLATRSPMKVAIIGSGWASYTLGQKLRQGPTLVQRATTWLRHVSQKLTPASASADFSQGDSARSHEVIPISATMISDRNHFLFTPLLASTCTGTVEYRNVAESVRRTLGSPSGAPSRGLTFRLDRVQRLEPVTRDGPDGQDVVGVRVCGQEREDHGVFDVVVVGIGALPAFHGTPGAREHAVTLRSIADARHVRRRLLAGLETASNESLGLEQRKAAVSFVFVGSGPTSVELVAELHDFLVQDAAKVYPIAAPLVQMTLIEASSQVLSAFSPELGSFAKSTMVRRRGMRVLTNVHPTAVHRDTIDLSDGTTLPHSLVVWSAGVEANPALASMGLRVDKAGYAEADDHLRAPGWSGRVFVMGDCAATSLPKTAQVAAQEAAWVATQLQSVSASTTTTKPPFLYRHLATLCYLGSYKGLAEVAKDSPLRLRGIGGWLVWRTAYLTQTVSWSNKLFIPLQWLKTFVFGRDTTYF